MLISEADGMTKLGLEVVAHTLDPGQIHQLAEEFDRADKTNNGEVSLFPFPSVIALFAKYIGFAKYGGMLSGMFTSVACDWLLCRQLKPL